MGGDVWALSYAQHFSSKNDTAKFCIQVDKMGNISLEIKENIVIKMPLPEIQQAVACSDDKYGWHGQIDLMEDYEIDFPKEWECTTLVPLMKIKTCVDLQKNYLGDGIKRKLSKDVSHECEGVHGKQIDGQILAGTFRFKTSKYNEWEWNEIFSYEFKKGFKVKIDGLCPEP